MFCKYKSTILSIYETEPSITYSCVNEWRNGNRVCSFKISKKKGRKICFMSVHFISIEWLRSLKNSDQIIDGSALTFVLDSWQIAGWQYFSNMTGRWKIYVRTEQNMYINLNTTIIACEHSFSVFLSLLNWQVGRRKKTAFSRKSIQ